MTKPQLSWRNAALPPKTALFAVGDIHAQNQLLGPMLDALMIKIGELPPDVIPHVVFIGDYIDRGRDGPGTIDLLLEFERRMMARGIGKVTFLCGNHDEMFKRLLEAREIIDEPMGNPDNKLDFTHCVTYKNGAINLRGLEDWMFSGGGVSTVLNYIPELDTTLFDRKHKCFNRSHPDFNLATINAMVKTLAQRVPPAHKDFFDRVYKNSHVIVGDYLLTHAGIDPNKPLQEQGIGAGAQPLEGKDYLDFLMLRNPFLWRDDNDLPNCPYIVVHGHTPSDIKVLNRTIADAQKDYRLCVDTNVYKPGGTLTCFMRYGDQSNFMSIPSDAPDVVHEYSIPPQGQWAAAVMHSRTILNIISDVTTNSNAQPAADICTQPVGEQAAHRA